MRGMEVSHGHALATEAVHHRDGVGVYCVRAARDVEVKPAHIVNHDEEEVEVLVASSSRSPTDAIRKDDRGEKEEESDEGLQGCLLSSGLL